MTDLDTRVLEFELWANRHLADFAKASSEQAAEHIGNALLAVDSGLGVEVGDVNEDSRDLIITAFSNATLFPLVQRIALTISKYPEWRVFALKPPRGFRFTLSVGKERIQAKTLTFRPIDRINGIQLLIDSATFKSLPKLKQAQELAWLIVETGVGERLSSRLDHIEFGDISKASEQLPIAELEGFLSR